MSYFLDTSALVKIYHEEAGSEPMHRLYRGKDAIYLSDLARIEFRSMLMRKHREGALSEKALHSVLERFDADVSERYHTIGFTSLVVEETQQLLETLGRTYPLRSLDAIQYAFYKICCEEDTFFVSADKRLLDAVAFEKTPIMNPEDS